MKDEQTYQRGDTIKLTCNFVNFDDIAIDPQEVKVTIYDTNQTLIIENILTIANKTDIGAYFYDYIADVDKDTRIIYEWLGTIEGEPSIKRGSFKIVFV